MPLTAASGRAPPPLLGFYVFKKQNLQIFFLSDEELPPGVFLFRGIAFGCAPEEPPPGVLLILLGIHYFK